MKPSVAIALTLALALSPALVRAEESDICKAKRKEIIDDFRKQTATDYWNKEYAAWRAKAWHAALLVAQRHRLIRESILNLPEGAKAQELYEKAVGMETWEGKKVFNEATELFVQAYNKRAFPVVMECPRDSTIDERVRDPEAHVSHGANKEDLYLDTELRSQLSSSERQNFDSRYFHSSFKMGHNFLYEREGSEEQRNEIPVKATMGWCRGDKGRPGEGDFRQPNLWSKPQIHKTNNGWGTGPTTFILTAADLRFAKKDEFGRTAPASELARQGYIAYSAVSTRDFLIQEPPTVEEVLDRMAGRPIQQPDESVIDQGLPSYCQKTAALALPPAATSDSDKAPSRGCERDPGVGSRNDGNSSGVGRGV